MREGGSNGVIMEFHRRKKILLQNFALCMILLAVGLALSQLADQMSNFLGISSAGWSAIAIAQMVIGIIFALLGFNQYRCPQCDAIPRAHDKYYLGVAIHPSRCPNCGSRLSQ
jgi:hypothetical protein